MPLSNPFKKLSKPQIYAVIGGSVLVGGIYEYQHHKSSGSWNPFSSSASGTATGSAIDPVTNLPVSEDDSIDPITNLPYLQEAEQYGSVAAAEAAVSAFGTTVNTGTGSSTAFGTQNDGSSTLAAGAVSSSTYTSNAAWSSAAVAGLADIGYPETDVATALGDYLSSTPVTATQANYIRAAISEFGNPPIGTFQIILVPVTPTGPTTGVSPSVPVAPVTPVNPPPSTPPATPPPATPPASPPATSKSTAPTVKIPTMPGNVRTSNITSSGFTVAWNASSGATSYRVRVTYQSNLVWNKTVSGTSVTTGGLTSDHTYTVHVAAINSAGTSSETNGPSVKTNS
jgi:Fibronectin type III domain